VCAGQTFAIVSYVIRLNAKDGANMKKCFFLFSLFLVVTLLASCSSFSIMPSTVPPTDAPVAPSDPAEPEPPEEVTPDPTPSGSDPTDIEWINVSSDTMSIDIPDNWAYDVSDDDSDWGIPGEIMLTSDIGSLELFVGYLVAGGVESFLADNPHTSFLFDTGDEGYMIESDDDIIWLHPFWGESGVHLWHDGDTSIFTENEELILQIVRSLRAVR